MHRRTFIARSAALTALGVFAPTSAIARLAALQPADTPVPTPEPAWPMTTLGRTGRTVPRLGFGAFPISRVKEEDEAVRILQHAIDNGVRYIDTAPSYGNGRSETRVGRAIKEGDIPREDFFISTKTLRRDATGARRELEESLKRLQTDYVDCVQCHEVHDDFESLFGDNAVLKALEKARDEGLIRHIGITAHRNPQHLIKAVERFDFKIALVPINPLDTKHLSFTRDFLPVAIERKIAVIAMKVFAGGALLRSGQFTAVELLQYALSQPGVNVVVPGCEAIQHVDEALTATRTYHAPLTDEIQRELETRTGEHHGKQSEWYKEEKK